MAQFYNPPPGQGQPMYGDATIAPYQQPMPVLANPQQQQQQQHHQQAQQHYPIAGQHFQPGQRPLPQYSNPGQPNIHNPNQNPNYIAQQQRQQQQLLAARQVQAHGFPQAGLQQPHLQPHPQQQPLHLQQPQQAFPQMHIQNQYSGYNAERSPMAPPSSGPMAGNMNTMPGMQPGNPQRPQSLQQLHTRNNSQALQFNAPDTHNWAAPTPPSGSATKQFFPQATPSPTKGLSTPLPPVPGATSMASASPPLQMTGLPQKAQPGQAPRPILSGPLSPEEAERERKRVGALLDLNTILLREIVQLQAAGRAGPPQKPGADNGGQASPTVTVPNSATSDTKEGDGEVKEGEGVEKKKQISSREYIECMRRVQANLAWLAVIADRSHKPLDKIPERPAIMEALPPIPGNSMSEEALQQLRDVYKHLKEIFPPASGGNGGGAGGGGGGGITGNQIPLPNSRTGSGAGFSPPHIQQQQQPQQQQQQQQQQPQLYPGMSIKTATSL